MVLGKVIQEMFVRVVVVQVSFINFVLLAVEQAKLKKIQNIGLVKWKAKAVFYRMKGEEKCAKISQ